MTVDRSHGQVWLAAALFPLKVYTVLGFVPLLIWHAKLPPTVQVPPWGSRRWPEYLDSARYDFTYFAQFAILAYFVTGVLLVLGGLTQALTCSRRQAILSISFGLAALIIGIILGPFGRSGPLTDITVTMGP
jgi:hypothetical protein